MVAKRTRIAVVAYGGIVDVPTRSIDARVGGAEVLVITVALRADASAVRASVADGARIAVVAWP